MVVHRNPLQLNAREAAGFLTSEALETFYNRLGQSAAPLPQQDLQFLRQCHQAIRHLLGAYRVEEAAEIGVILSQWRQGAGVFCHLPWSIAV